MTERVGIEFDGNGRGAIAAARQTSTAVEQVSRSARESSQPLRGMTTDLGRVERGALAGSGALHGMGRAALYLGSTYIGAFGLGAALRAASDELVQQVKLGAQTGAVLRSTGGVAGVTARMIDQLASAEERKTGVDHNQIKAAELMLLRYTNVRDVAGQGNDVFARATKTALDLSVALGRDASDAAFTLGKALNDPTRGVQQLRRVGAAFTAEEATHIKTLAEHGHVLEAQKAILDSLSKSYSGTAEAVGKVEPWNRAKEAVRQLGADALRPLLPDIDHVVGRVRDWADGLEHNRAEQQRLKADVEAGAAAIKQFVKGADDVAGALGGWRTVLGLVLAYKVAETLGGWTTAFRTLIGAEAAAGAASGVAGASAEVGVLNSRLKVLRGIAATPFKIIIAYELLKQITGKGVQDSTSAAGDLVPVYRNGKWVDPNTGIPVADQAYWNRQFQRDNPGATPTAGATAHAGASTPTNAAGIVGTAKHLGVGSGGVYGQTPLSTLTGGAIASNRVVDCSAYVYAVYTENGFKDFPATSETQWSTMSGGNWTSEKVNGYGDVKPGDVVFMVGAGYPSPGHVGIVTSGSGFNARVMQYYSTGKQADTIGIAEIGDLVGIKRFYLIKKPAGKGKPGADPPRGGGGTSTSASNPLPASVRQAISVADIAAARAALTPGKADDKAAIAEQRRAVEAEIAWLNAKLATKLGPEKRITYEDLLTGALSDLKQLQTTKTPKGASIGVITALRNTVAQDLQALPATLDQVEATAVAHLKSLRSKLKVGLDAKDLADTRAGIQNWGKVLKNEISKQAQLAADAAQEASRLWQRGWSNDVNRVLRDFQENVVDKQLTAFDRETQTGLQSIAAKFAAQTPEEVALAAFQQQRSAADEAKQKADLLSQIADVQSQLNGLGASTDGGVLIDIATGKRTALQQAGTSIVDQQKQLTSQLLDLQDQYHQLDLNDQEAALQASADLSRTAADQKASDAEQTYQDDRDRQRVALADRLADQQTALQQDLDDWNIWLGKKQKSWDDFLQYLRDHGVDTAGIGNPADNPAVGQAGPVTLPGGLTVAAGVIGHGFGGSFAQGGNIPGTFVGREDTVFARVTPGERVLSRRDNAALQRLLRGGGAGGQMVTILTVDGRELARQTATPMSAEQARQIGYTIQRG